MFFLLGSQKLWVFVTITEWLSSWKITKQVRVYHMKKAFKILKQAKTLLIFKLQKKKIFWSVRKEKWKAVIYNYVQSYVIIPNYTQL